MSRSPALALAFLVALPLAGAAQTADTPPSSPPGMHGMLMGNPAEAPDMQDLKLTPDQQAKLKSIFADAQARHDVIRQEVHQQVSQVLTPEQMKKWEERQSRRMEMRAERMDRRDERKDRREERMKERAGKP